MPHLWAKINISQANPASSTPDQITQICSQHGATRSQVWHDDPVHPQSAYVLIHHDEAASAAPRLQDALQAEHVVQLHDPSR